MFFDYLGLKIFAGCAKIYKGVFIIKSKKICVLGLGYIGLPTASLLANNGFEVVGIDKKSNIIGLVNDGGIHIEEPGLKALVSAAINSGRLKATTEVEEADVFFIAVPTPVNKAGDDVTVDLSYVEQAAREILPFLKKGNLVILESTSPPGTSSGVVAPILAESGLKAGEDYYLAHCPERVLPGRTLKELIQNDRIIGGINLESAEKARELYKKFVEGDVLLTDATTAEMAKLIENIYRDVNIALANEISTICEIIGIDVWETIKLANLHPRVNIHLPGPGVGGHCISVDPWFIISAFKKEAQVMALSRRVNDERPQKVVDRLLKILDGRDCPVVTIMGVAYKGNIDDTRESPALDVLELLIEKKVAFKVYDPHVSNFDYETRSLKEAFTGSDCAVVLADHDEFRFLYPRELAGLMRTKQVFDTRNCLDGSLWVDNGFIFYLLGKG